MPSGRSVLRGKTAGCVANGWGDCDFRLEKLVCLGGGVLGTIRNPPLHYPPYLASIRFYRFLAKGFYPCPSALSTA